MISYQYDETLLIEHGQVFPDEIVEDTWVVFHGTSGQFEKEIEKNGLSWQNSKITKKIMEDIVAIYTKLNWCGLNNDGLAVLNPWSLKSDFSTNKVKPIFFGESCYRASWFAMHGFAGGESARAIRFAIEDLETFLEDTGVRENYLNNLNADFEEYGCVTNHFTGDILKEPPKMPDLNWLRIELKKLVHVKKYCDKLYLNHNFGVVYAVKFSTEDLPNIEYRKSMGVVYHGTVIPEKLIAKICFPSNWMRPYSKDWRRIAFQGVGESFDEDAVNLFRKRNSKK